MCVNIHTQQCIRCKSTSLNKDGRNIPRSKHPFLLKRTPRTPRGPTPLSLWSLEDLMALRSCWMFNVHKMLTKCYTMLYLREMLLLNKNSLRNLFLCFHTESTMMYDLFYDFIMIPFMISLVLWLHSDYDFSMFFVLKLPISNNQKLLCSYCLWKMPVVQCHCLIVSLWLQFWFHFVFLILKSHSKTINWIVVRSKWDPLSKILCCTSLNCIL